MEGTARTANKEGALARHIAVGLLTRVHIISIGEREA
jgi:hypothetical protein